MKKNLLKTTMLIVAVLCANIVLMAQVNMTRYITLKVTNGADIVLNLAADVNNTPVKIVSGDQEYDMTLNAHWSGFDSYLAGDTIMRVYGNIQMLDCSCNWEDLTELDVVRNRRLTELIADSNHLTSLKLSGCEDLERLSCSDNQLTNLRLAGCRNLDNLSCGYNQLASLDVSHCTALTGVYCCSNQLTSLDVSMCPSLLSINCDDNQISNFDMAACPSLLAFNCERNLLTSLNPNACPRLKYFSCNDNPLTDLDVSNCSDLVRFYCCNSQLTSLDISQNTEIKILSCAGNPFTTQVIDDIYCALSDRAGLGAGSIYVLYNVDDPNYANVLASNKRNAINKYWRVKYLEDQSSIPATTGTYVCGVAVAGVDVSPTSVSLQAGEQVQLTATISPGNASNQNVIWSSSNNNIATVDANGVVTGVAVGNATITVTTEEGGYTATCLVETYDGIAELSMERIAEVYPNPVTETLYIDLASTSDFTMELYNVHGQLVLQAQNTASVAVAHLPKGVYVLKLMIDKQVYSTKIVK